MLIFTCFKYSFKSLLNFCIFYSTPAQLVTNLYYFFVGCTIPNHTKANTSANIKNASKSSNIFSVIPDPRKYFLLLQMNNFLQNPLKSQ